MTLAELIQVLQGHLASGGSEQYQAELKRQIERLTHYLLHGEWPGREGSQ